MSDISLHHVGFEVADATARASYYRDRFSMRPVATQVKSNLETHVLASSEVIFTIAGGSESSLREHVRKHGDAILDIALAVEDVDGVIERARAAGAPIIRMPETLEDDGGSVRLGSFAVFGDMRHTVIDDSGYKGCFLPGFELNSEPRSASPVFDRVDHFTICIKPGETNRWIDFYHQIFGFSVSQTFGDCKETSMPIGLATTIVSDDHRRIQLALTEPTPKLGGSQIDAFMKAHQGAGVQHVALATNDIVECVTELRRGGVAFMETPESYYTGLTSRVGYDQAYVDRLRTLGILVEREDSGDLLQIFTKSEHRPATSFFEIIERRGAVGFGEGNVRALAESVDREAQFENCLFDPRPAEADTAVSGSSEWKSKRSGLSPSTYSRDQRTLR